MTQYSIKDLEYLSGIKAHTIRIWEKRYQLFVPQRSTTNIRFYSDDDVRKILNVAMLIKNGYRISNVASYDDFRLHSEVIRLNQSLLNPEKNIDQLILKIVNFDTYGFEQLLDQMIKENGFQKTIQETVFPFFEQIGLLWQVGSIYVAHEHFISNLVRKKLIIETAKYDNNNSDITILFFLREDEWHELGLLYFNYLAVENGFRSVYLGQSLPFSDLQGLLKSTEFEFVCTTFTNSIEKQELEQYLSNLSIVFNRNRILVAGRQIEIHKPRLPKNTSAIKIGKDFVKKIL